VDEDFWIFLRCGPRGGRGAAFRRPRLQLGPVGLPFVARRFTGATPTPTVRAGLPL